MNFSIRPYLPTDLDAIQRLTAELWPVPIEREFFWASAPQMGKRWPAVWVAEQNGRIVGFSRLDKNEFLPSETLTFVVVNVHPNAQSAGIGRALVQQAEAFAVAHGQTILRTSARSDLTRLTQFWQAQGFGEVLRGGPLMVWKSLEKVSECALRFETLADFLQRPDAALLLADPLNHWNKIIHEGLPFPPAGLLSGEDWLETLQETADLEHSLVAWKDKKLKAFVTFYVWEGKPDELALNLDATLDILFAQSPQLHLEAVAYAMAQAFSAGSRQIVFEAQPHFGWANKQLATLEPEIIDRPVWVLMDKNLTAPAP